MLYCPAGYNFWGYLKKKYPSHILQSPILRKNNSRKGVMAHCGGGVGPRGEGAGSVDLDTMDKEKTQYASRYVSLAL